ERALARRCRGVQISNACDEGPQEMPWNASRWRVGAARDAHCGATRAARALRSHSAVYTFRLLIVAALVGCAASPAVGDDADAFAALDARASVDGGTRLDAMSP